jgi:hypothetical protein
MRLRRRKQQRELAPIRALAGPKEERKKRETTSPSLGGRVYTQGGK